MTYAIGNIVYGVDLQYVSWGGSKDNFAAVRSEIEERCHDGEFITQQYSGNGEPPIYFGVGEDAIDETETIDGVDLIKRLTPSLEIITAYQAKLSALDDAVKAGGISQALADAIKAVEPRMFITWGSS